MNQLLVQTKQNPARVLLICALALALLAVSLFASTVVLLGIVALAALALVVWKPRLGLALLPFALFFEADQFSLTLPFGRVRLYHLLIVLLALRVLLDLARGKIQWRSTPLDLPLALYVLVNWAAVWVAPVQGIALKIAGLITLLAFLYWSITQLIRTKKDFLHYTRLLLSATVAIALYGLFQVFAVWFASRFEVTLWSGVVIHSDVIPYGRPYGTFVEPDWFGTIMAAALVGVGLLSFAKAFKNRQVELLGISGILLVATVLSAVRGGWLAAIVAVPVLLVFNHKKLKLLDASTLPALLVTVAVVSVAVLAVTPAVRHALTDRVATLTTPSTLEVEPRFLIMQDGWQLFRKHPAIGRGPGAYTTLGTLPFVRPMTAAIYGIENFQTNAFLTVLIDTGLIGLVLALLLLWRLIKTLWQALTKTLTSDPQVRAVLFCLAGAGLTLLLGYQVSTGMWLGLTWYLVSLIIVGSLIEHSSTK
ncbi:MAG: O-antigen ligase family protein [Candidatus Andersenbacteria bacterium]